MFLEVGNVTSRCADGFMSLDSEYTSYTWHRFLPRYFLLFGVMVFWSI